MSDSISYELGLQKKEWVKTSLAPGSRIVTDYLKASGLQDYLNKMGFYTVGYGCTTCIGNSGPLDEKISQSIHKQNLVVTSVLSGNRNFDRQNSQEKSKQIRFGKSSFGSSLCHS